MTSTAIRRQASKQFLRIAEAYEKPATVYNWCGIVMWDGELGTHLDGGRARYGICSAINHLRDTEQADDEVLLLMRVILYHASPKNSIGGYYFTTKDGRPDKARAELCVDLSQAVLYADLDDIE